MLLDTLNQGKEISTDVISSLAKSKTSVFNMIVEVLFWNELYFIVV